MTYVLITVVLLFLVTGMLFYNDLIRNRNLVSEASV